MSETMTIDRPTVFYNSREVDEAVECGYLSSSCGYATHGDSPSDTCNNKNFPTMFWKSGYGHDNMLSHQPNDDGIWANTDYEELYQNSVLWSATRAKHMLPRQTAMVVMTSERLVLMGEGLKNGASFMLSGVLNGELITVEVITEAMRDARSKC